MKTKFTSDQRLGRQFGLGRDAQGLSQEQLTAYTTSTLQSNFSNLAVIEYVTQTFELPLLDSTLNSTLGDEVELSTPPKIVPGAASSSSSFAINGLLQVDMFVVGIGAHIFSEPSSSTVLGNVISGAVPAAAAGPLSPDAYATNYDLTNTGTPSANPLGLAAATTMTPGLLEWGSPAWNAMWHMTNAYQFDWTVCQRFNVIQEMLADFCYFGSYADAEGFSSSQTAGQRYARRANDTYQGLGFVGAFVPINAQRIGVTTTVLPFSGTGLATGTARSIFKPTRAYDEVNTSFGGIGCQNRSSNTPYRKLPKAVLLEKGSPIQMSLSVQDAFHYNEMRRYLSISDGYGGTNALVSYAGNGASGVTVAAASINELTLDATPLLVSFQTNTDRMLMKGGAFMMSILVKGFEVCNSWRGMCSSLVGAGLAVTANTGSSSWGGSYNGGGQ